MSHSSDREEETPRILQCLGGHFELDATPPGIRSMREIVSSDDLLAVAGKGLLPVPTADVLVRSILSNVDQPDSTVGEGVDKCCGCGGCDKNKS